MEGEDLALLRRRGAPEDETIAAARARTRDVDVVPSPELGSFIRWAASLTGARHAVEVGSGGGVSGLWMLAGMGERGILTSIEPESERQSLAAQAFDEAGVAGRVRTMPGEPAQMLERLGDDGYDLCLLHSPPNPSVLHEVLRVVRPGGVVIVRGLTTGPDWDALVAETAEDDRLVTAVLPVDDGTLIISLL